MVIEEKKIISAAKAAKNGLESLYLLTSSTYGKLAKKYEKYKAEKITETGFIYKGKEYQSIDYIYEVDDEWENSIINDAEKCLTVNDQENIKEIFGYIKLDYQIYDLFNDYGTFECFETVPKCAATYLEIKINEIDKEVNNG